MLDDSTVAIDLIIIDKYEEREPSYTKLEYTRELTKEELHTFKNDFRKHLGVHLTKDDSAYIEKWIV